MNKAFEVTINGVARQFSAHTNADDIVSLCENGADTPCVVLTRAHMLDRSFGTLVNEDELIDLAISQATQHSLIHRAFQEGKPVHEVFTFVPNTD